MIGILSLVLFLLIIVFCGDRGSKSIVSTCLNGFCLVVVMYMMYLGMNPLIVTVIACVFISAVILFYQNEGDIKSKITFASVTIVIMVLIPFLYYLTTKVHTIGFSQENYEITDTNGYNRNIGVNMLLVQISVMIIALIGTVVDIGIAITTSIYEITYQNPSISRFELTKSAFIVSRSILSTSIHTIFYIYIAEYMALMIQYVEEYSFLELINSKSFCGEALTLLISGIGCALMVPVATMLSVSVFKINKH